MPISCSQAPVRAAHWKGAAGASQAPADGQPASAVLSQEGVAWPSLGDAKQPHRKKQSASAPTTPVAPQARRRAAPRAVCPALLSALPAPAAACSRCEVRQQAPAAAPLPADAPLRPVPRRRRRRRPCCRRRPRPARCAWAPSGPRSGAASRYPRSPTRRPAPPRPSSPAPPALGPRAGRTPTARRARLRARRRARRRSAGCHTRRPGRGPRRARAARWRTRAARRSARLRQQVRAERR